MGGKNTKIFFCLQLSAEEVSLKKLIELFLSQFSDLAGSVWRGMDVCLGRVDCPKKMKKMEEKNIEKKIGVCVGGMDVCLGRVDCPSCRGFIIIYPTPT